MHPSLETILFKSSMIIMNNKTLLANTQHNCILKPQNSSLLVKLEPPHVNLPTLLVVKSIIFKVLTKNEIKKLK